MGLQIGKAGLSVADRVDFFRTLSEWMSSGGGQMSLAEAVRNTTGGFSQEEYAALAPQMENIASEVTGGQTTFYEALADSNLGFRPQELAVIEAAERSSQMRQTLPSLVSALETEQNGKRDLFAKLAGPSVIGVMLIALTIGVLVILLPLVITPVIERNDEALDRFPTILLGLWYASVGLRAHYIPILAALFGVIMLFMCRNTALLQPFWLRFLLRWGVSRKLVLGFNSMVVVYYLPTLLRSGMPSPQALETLAGCVTNPLIASLLMAAAEDHRGGLRMSQALVALPFKASFFNALESGEATGAVADRVQDLQGPYRYDLERYIKQVGSTIKFMVMTVLLPLFIISAYGSFVGPIFALMEYN